MLILAVIILITALLFVNVKIKIRFNLAESLLRVNLTVGGIPVKRKKKPNSKTKIYYDIVKHIAENIKTEYLRFNILIGFEEPTATVFAAQVLRNAFMAVYKLFRHSIKRSSKIYVKIMPAFAQNVISADLDCIINIKAVHIIRAFAKHYFNILKNRIRRKINAKTDPSNNGNNASKNKRNG